MTQSKVPTVVGGLVIFPSHALGGLGCLWSCGAWFMENLAVNSAAPLQPPCLPLLMGQHLFLPGKAAWSSKVSSGV